MPIGPAQAQNADFGRGQPVSPTAAVPFQRRVDPQQMSTALTVQQHEQRRLQRYAESWNFYYGRQWSYTREDGEPLVTLNYFRKLIDKTVSFLFGQGVTYTVPEALELVTLPLIERIWKDNRESELYFEIGTMGAVTGDCFILVTYEEPKASVKRVNPYARGRIRLNLVSSEQVFPEWNPLDITEMLKVRIETVVLDPAGKDPAVQNVAPVDMSGNDGSRSIPGYIRYTQVITPEEIVMMKAGEVIERQPNRLGEIPLVHIKNQPIPSEYYGLPDGQDLVDLQRELNEKATDISDVVNYHAGPITVITGAKAKQLDRSPRKIWSGLPEKATVTNLSYDGDMAASQQYMDRIKKAMHELSDVPENALGSQQAISNTSGVALSMLYRPLIEKTEKKKATYGPGLEKVNYFILRIAQEMGLVKLKFDLCETCGGRIVEHEVEVPGSDDGTGKPIVRIKKDCFEIDPQSLDFLDPMEMKVKFLQQYPEGTEVREEEFWKILLGYRRISESFWQPDEKPPEPPVDPNTQPPVGSGEDHNALPSDPSQPGTQQPRTPEQQEYAARPTKIGVSKGGTIHVPPEPVRVQVTERSFDASGKEQVTRGQVRTLVPTECSNPEYLNPFKTDANFPSPLPRDEKLEAELYQALMSMKLVGRKWVQKQLPRLKNDLAAINKEIEEDGVPDVTGAKPNESLNTDFNNQNQGSQQ